MSIAQRNDVRLVAVDPQVGDVLRTQTLAVLEFNHHYFEDLRDFGPEAQVALSVIYRDAFAVLDALGWRPDPDAAPTEVPLSDGHVEHLARCRYDLGRRNLDRLDERDAATDAEVVRGIDAAIEADRVAARCLDRVMATYQRVRGQAG